LILDVSTVDFCRSLAANRRLTFDLITPRGVGALLRWGALPQPARLMEEAEFHRHVGVENTLPNVESALRRAEQILGMPSADAPDLDRTPATKEVSGAADPEAGRTRTRRPHGCRRHGRWPRLHGREQTA
jgi:hypothetical protein